MSQSQTAENEVAKVSARRRGVRRRLPKNVDGTMSIVSHIQEIRRRLVIALIFILIGTIFGYWWYGSNIGPIPSLGEILRQPYCQLPPEARFGSANGECRLLATSPFEMFLLRMKVGFLAGIVLMSPVWLGQIWGFITPGLRKNEKRWTMSVSMLAGLLFVVGATLAYLVLHNGLYFLLTVGEEAQIAALTGQQYFGFMLGLLLIFGVSFELPLLTVMLSFAGLITYKQISSKRRYIIVGLFAFAAVITPADPFSMIALGLSLTLMMEIAYLIIWFNDRRRKKRNANNPDWDVDATSPVAAADAVDSAAPVEAASAIEGSSGTAKRNSFNYAEVFRDESPGDGA